MCKVTFTCDTLSTHVLKICHNHIAGERQGLPEGGGVRGGVGREGGWRVVGSAPPPPLSHRIQLCFHSLKSPKQSASPVGNSCTFSQRQMRGLGFRSLLHPRLFMSLLLPAAYSTFLSGWGEGSFLFLVTVLASSH